ncbi:hypothetical protein LPJ66_009995 [Kickxella alabastrina]|uniref:Uncharacterized protein n=1 Tax=Kickxella alabastrina TaxID=61397 RepID=A0ACC1I5X3_9FUNG|nr:hypothetical protein LPJ66_009995 [Kickxella alabastrina]
MEVSQSMKSYLDSRQVADWLAGDFRLVLTLTRVADSDESGAFAYYVSLLAIDGTEATVVDCGTTRINPAYLATQPLTCAFDADTGALVILTEAGVYQQLSLTTGSSALDDAILLERTKEVVLRGFVTCVNDAGQGSVAAPNLLNQSQLSLAALSERYVAIAGTHSVVSHARTGPYESVLTLWDLQYGCMHAEKKLTVDTEYLHVSGSKGAQLPRLTYQVQSLSPRLNEGGTPSDQVSLAVTVAHTSKPHVSFDSQNELAKARPSKKGKKASAAASASAVHNVPWSVETFVVSAYLPPVTLLASLRRQNNAKYFVDPVEQAARTNVVHSSNILMHEELEQGLNVLRSGWEAIVDGTTPSKKSKLGKAAVTEAFQNIATRREATQQLENDALLALANVSDAVDSEQYTLLFMDHVGVKYTPEAGIDDSMDTWISAYLMTTVMRRCFAEPLGVSRSSRLPLFAPYVIEFMLINCGLCNSHAPAPGLLPQLLARVDSKKNKVLTSDPAWNLVNIALTRCPDLPERQIVSVLQYQLAHYAKYIDQLFAAPSADDGDSMQDDAVEDISADVMRTVGAIAALASNSDTMQIALSALHPDHIACIIRLLVVWMREWTLVGANVEITASARFLAASDAAQSRIASEYKDSDKGDILTDAELQESYSTASDLIKQVIKRAQNLTTISLRGVPSVMTDSTVFVAPQAVPKTTDHNQHFAFSITSDWAPALTLPSQLSTAPTLDQVVDFAASILDAHISSILLSDELRSLVGQLKAASDAALSISDQLKLLRASLLPFYAEWEKQQQERIANELAHQKVQLGLDEEVMPNGTTRSQVERQNGVQPDARVTQGAGPAGRYWERVQNLEKYRVEVMNW